MIKRVLGGIAGARHRRDKKGWWIRVAAGGVLLTASFFFLGYVVYQGWDTFLPLLRQVDWRLVGLAFALYPLGLVPVTWAWHRMMSRIGGCKDARTNVRLYCLSSLPKRIPSSIWYIASRIVLYRDRDVRPAVTLAATALETTWFVLAGFALYLLSLPFGTGLSEPGELDWRLIGVAGTCLVLALSSSLWAPLLLRGVRWLLGRLGVALPIVLNAWDVLSFLGISGLAWIGGGIVLYVLANAVTSVPVSQLPALLGAWGAAGATSMSAGLLVSGMGLRELTLTVLLGRLMPLPVAAAVSLLFRLLLTVGEFVWALVFVALTRLASESP